MGPVFASVTYFDSKDTFHSTGQAESIKRILQCKPTLLVLPTGKSHSTDRILHVLLNWHIDRRRRQIPLLPTPHLYPPLRTPRHPVHHPRDISHDFVDAGSAEMFAGRVEGGVFEFASAGTVFVACCRHWNEFSINTLFVY